MAEEDQKPSRKFGPDYPKTATVMGIPMPLIRESRFARFYQSKSPNIGTFISRFHDGSASITLAELEKSWLTWTADDRKDFLQGSNWLSKHSEFSEIIRFVSTHSDHNELSYAALTIVNALPTDEAFQLLSKGLSKTRVGNGSNLLQAIAQTKHHKATNCIRTRLEKILNDPQLKLHDDFVNWITLEAAHCIEYLIGLENPKAEFAPAVYEISEYASEQTLDSIRRSLTQWYPWLGKPSPAWENLHND